jgi:hypothetical protein
MARRNYTKTEKGMLYCIEWPEWHVECAANGCEEQALVAALGMATNIREAERVANNNKEEQLEGWKKRSGKWCCPNH